MDKEQRKSVNFEKNAEVSEFDEWDDEFDEDSDDDIKLQSLNPETNKTNIDEINANDVELKVKPSSYQIPINDNRSSLNRRGSKMMGLGNRRATIYEPKPKDFSYDPTLEGPIDARVITDICCFMLFFVFFAIWGFSTWLVFSMGNLERFAVPKAVSSDSASSTFYELCGSDKTQAQNKYELNFNLFKCIDPLVAFRTCKTKTVCVDKCPTKSFSFRYYKDQKDYNKEAYAPDELKDAIQCISISGNIDKMADAERLIEENNCAEITTKSIILEVSEYKTWQYKCIPDLMETEIDFIIDLLDQIVPQTSIKWRITYELTKRIGHDGTGNSTLNANKIWYTFSDMLEGGPVLIGFLVVALFLTLLLVYSMKFLARFIFIITNVFNAAILAISIYMCYSRGNIFEEFSLNKIINDIWGLSLVSTSIVAIIVLLQFLIERTGTLIILELIKETTTAIQYIKTLLVFPVIFYFIRIVAILLSMYIGFTIKSTSETDFVLTNKGVKNATCDCNNYIEGEFCNPTVVKDCMHEFQQKLLGYCILHCDKRTDTESHKQFVGFSQLTNLVGYFWVFEYLYLLELAIVASTFATYYWTFHKREIPTFTLINGIYICIRYHLGTIFFAWLFICMYSYIRFEIKVIDNMLGLLPFSIIHFFFKYVMIVMALCGDDFYESAKEAVRLVKLNARLIIISKLMSEILFFYLKLLITAIMGLVVYIVVLCIGLINPDYFKNDLFPVYIVCTGTYLIATEIFNIYILGVDTFTFCYIEDCTMNDGSDKAPYFMPRPLMRICHKKNNLDVSSYDNHKNLKSVK